MLIGITGRKGSGKNAAASIILNTLGGREFAFADELKRACGRIWGLNHRQLYGDLKEVVDPRWNKTPREIMQLFGTEVGRSISAETWIKNTLEVAIPAQRARDSRWCTPWTWSKSRVAVITDVRFPNEAAAVHNAGGVVVKVIRPGMPQNEFSNHASEIEIDRLPCDYAIVNDAGLLEFNAKVYGMALHIAGIRSL